jgi:hypothetical protein
MRSRVLKGAKIVIGTSSLIDCTVRNLTNGGARVEIACAIYLPDRMDVTFDACRSFRSCRLAWRTTDAAGLEFLEGAAA